MIVMSKNIAAIAQLCSTSNKLTNLYNIAHCAGWAQMHGASMLFLPECLGFIGSNAEETLLNAETIPLGTENYCDNDNTSREPWHSLLEDVVRQSAEITGSNQDILLPMKDEDHQNNNQVSILDGLRVIARKSNLYISAGGIHESGAPPKDFDEENSNTADRNVNSNRVYNTHVILNNKGDIISKYRKIHLFDVSIPSKGINLCESNTTAPGNELVVCDSPLGRLGLSTCYDVRFPEMYQDLSGKGQAEILLVPSAFTVPTGKAHWHTLLRARAIENQCYLLASAQFGRHNEKRESYGHSLAISPWGEVIDDAGGYDSTEMPQTPRIILCEIDLDTIKSVKERMPIQSHRNKNKYASFF